MKSFLFLGFILFLTSCGGKKDDGGSACTKQDLNSRNIVISCVTLKQEKPTKCTASGAGTSLCELGFDTGCQPARIEPQTIKAYVRETKTVGDSEEIVLINKNNGKQMFFRQISDYLIIKHFDDPGNSSTVDLPTCSEI